MGDIKPLRARDKRVKRHKRAIERYHMLVVEDKYREFYDITIIA
jgi:hypothetical protein